jgi:hypothetical protein
MNSNISQGMKVVLMALAATVLVLLVGALFPFPTALSPSRTPVPTPAPRQQAGLFSLSATDDNGDKWALGLNRVPAQWPVNNSSMKHGAPLLVKADVHSAGRSISIGLVIEGQAGEVYRPGATKNGSRVAPPKFKIIDESGAVIGSGSFEYG